MKGYLMATTKTTTLKKDSVLYINWGIIGDNTHESAGLYKYTGKSFPVNGSLKLIFINVKTGEQLSPMSESQLEGKCKDLGLLKASASTEVSSVIFS